MIAATYARLPDAGEIAAMLDLVTLVVGMPPEGMLISGETHRPAQTAGVS